MRAEDVERRLGEALRARTQDVYSDPDSLQHIRQGLRHPSRPTRNVSFLAIAAAVGLITVAAAYVGLAVRGDIREPLRPAHAGPLPTVGTGYPAGEYYVAVAPSTRLVVVRTADGAVVRSLPVIRQSPLISLQGAVLSRDGTRVYGWWHDPVAGPPYGVPTASEHVCYIDLKTNHVIVVASRPGSVTGLSVSADGNTIAYALLDRSVTPNRTTIFAHDLRRDRDHSYAVAPGRQVIPMSLSPDGSRLALTQTHTEAVLFIADLNGPRAVLDARPTSLSACTRGIHYNPQWTVLGLFAIRQCNKPHGDHLVRLDPDSGRELGSVADLPDDLGAVDHMQVLVRTGRPVFLLNAGPGYEVGVYELDPRRSRVPQRVGTVLQLSGSG